MRIETNHIIIRDFERKDAENLYQIVREKNKRYAIALLDTDEMIGMVSPTWKVIAISITEDTEI